MVFWPSGGGGGRFDLKGGGTRGEFFFGGQRNPDFVEKTANFLLFSRFLQNFRPPAAAGGGNSSK